jgi:cation diffusion facilitator family transporter
MPDRDIDRLKQVRKEARDPSRRALYLRAVLIAILGNLLLAVAKGLVAWSTGSSAVLSDAANSLSDTLYSLLMGAGLYVAQQPADESHPQGHSRFEPLVSLLIAMAMGVATYSALRQAVGRFVAGGRAVGAGWPTVVLLGGVAAKVIMYRVVMDLGHRASSPALRASARDNLADVVASVAAWIGVLGSSLVHPLLDPIAGLVVALWILRAMWEILYENLGYLTGRGAPADVTADIVEAASSVPGVINVHQVIADYVGPELRVDMHIDVDGEMTLHEAHAISERVAQRVEGLSSVDLAFVHVEPVDHAARQPVQGSEPKETV